MTDSFITQCPHCGTSFRVREDQLAVANGSVRCGACLQVFSARNHVMTTAMPVQKASAQPKANLKPVPKAAKKVTQSANANTKSAQQKVSAKPKAPAKKVAAKPKAVPSPKAAARKVEARKPVSKKPPPPNDDEFNFRSDNIEDTDFLFSDEDDDFVFSDGPEDDLFDEDANNDEFGELSDSFLNLNSKTDERTPKSDPFQQETQSVDSDVFDALDDETDESWAESMLEEMEKEDKSASKPAVFESKPVSARSTRQVKAQPVDDFSNASLLDIEEDFNDMSATSALRTPSAVVNRASSEVELDFNIEERLGKLKPLGWLAVALLLIVLALQLAWFQRDTLARMDQWRGLYQQACAVFGCTLPEQVDLNQIRYTVLVREHRDPNLNDLRIVDVVLTNRAAFKQNFPLLILQYTDVNGNLIADQSFHPDDYLRGEMTGIELMPINTRVYVSLPIQTPPNNAINYQLALAELP